MPCLLAMLQGREIDRRDLTGPVVIGRAPDCDLPVRDILLSRRHCRVEPLEDGRWRAIDLASKNGTTLNDCPIAGARTLADGDSLALGRLRILFRSASLARVGLTPLCAPAVPMRPADPMETLSGTLAGFQYLEPGQSPAPANIPLPRPEPRRPAAYAREDIDSLLTAIASSSWDSIYEQARQPARTMVEINADLKSARRPRPLSPADLSARAVGASPAPGARPKFNSRRPSRRGGEFSRLAALLTILLILKLNFGGLAGVVSPPAARARIEIPPPAPPNDSAALIVRAVEATLPIFL